MEKKIKETTHHIFVLTDQQRQKDRDYINRRIKEYNNAVSSHHRQVRKTGLRPLDIFIRDQQGQLVGGLVADTYWDWLDIDDLWLDERLRGQGYGRELMRLAETEAGVRGCRRAQLKTFSFQARGFYEKLGYQVVGQLEDYPPGQTFYWMRKDFYLAL